MTVMLMGAMVIVVVASVSVAVAEITVDRNYWRREARRARAQLKMSEDAEDRMNDVLDEAIKIIHRK